MEILAGNRLVPRSVTFASGLARELTPEEADSHALTRLKSVESCVVKRTLVKVGREREREREIWRVRAKLIFSLSLSLAPTHFTFKRRGEARRRRPALAKAASTARRVVLFAPFKVNPPPHDKLPRIWQNKAFQVLAKYSFRPRASFFSFFFPPFRVMDDGKRKKKIDLIHEYLNFRGWLKQLLVERISCKVRTLGN